MKRVLLAFSASWRFSSQARRPMKWWCYTAHEESIINALVPMFEKETGIKVNYVKPASGDVIKRAKAEANNPQADVIWSIGGEQLEARARFSRPTRPRIGTDCGRV